MKKKSQNICRFILFLVLFLLAFGRFNLLAQTTGDYRSNVTTGSWNTVGTWQRFDGSNWVGATAVPTSSNNVTIQSGHTITENTTASCKNLTINGTLTWSSAYTLSVSGNLTISGGTLSGSRTGTVNVTGTFNVPASTTANIQRVTLTVTGATTISGTVNFNADLNGTKTFIGLVTINSGGTWTNPINESFTFRGGITNNGTFNSGTGTSTFNTNNQAINGSSPLVFGSTVSISGTITITNNTTVNITGNLTGSLSSSTWFNAANSVLNAGNAVLSIGTLNASTNSNTVNYTKAGNQTVKATTYHHLTLSTSGTKTLTGLSTVNGNLTSSGTVNAQTATNLTIGGNFTIGSGTTITIPGYSINVTGTTSVSGTLAHGSSFGTKTYNGDVTINSGGSWTNSNNAAFTIGGNLQNNGTLTAGTGTYTLNGASKTLSGSSGITIPYLTITGSYTNNTTTTVSTSLSGTGGTLTQGINSILNIGGTSGISNLVATANNNTVNYTGTAQTIKSTNYYHLTLKGSGAKTLPSSQMTVFGNFTTAPSSTMTASAGNSINVTGNVVLGIYTSFTANSYSHTIGGNWSNNGATFIPSTGTITFNGSTTQTIGGSSTTTFYTLGINNTSGVGLNQPIATVSLNLTAGLVTTTSTNLLTVTGTTPGNITWNSATSYVNGPLALTLPATTANVTYLFPVGKSTYNPLELVNANTNSGGSVVIKAEVFDENCGGSAGEGLAVLNTNRYWNASVTSGTSNFTNSLVRLTEYNLGIEDAIGQSSSKTGAYTQISENPPSGNTLTSWTTPALTTLGFFAIGEKPSITVTATPNVTEGGTNGSFTFTTSKPFPTSKSINFTISGTATNGTDYTTITSPLTFPAGQSTVTLPVSIVNDNYAETTETVIITLASGTGYSIGTASTATVSITDNDFAGITVSPTSGLTTTEAEGQATFTVKLNSQPTSDVSIVLSSNDLTEGTITPTSLTFTSANWNTTQTVTVTGVNDFVQDGNISYSIVTSPATSFDTNYKNLDASDVSVTNTDNDIAGITVSSISGPTSEAGSTATFTIVLNTQPTADVTINITSGNTAEGTVAPTSVTFNASNWSTAQTITVTGVDDFMVDGTVNYTIITSQATSSDPVYNVINPANVTVQNTDNDVAGFTVNPTTGLSTTEAGGQASFSIVLKSKPSANVTITLISDDTTEGTVSPASVTFTGSNWNTLQTITITGVNDAVDDGDIVYHIITNAATSSDTNYNNQNPSDVTVTNTDNDTAGITVTPISGLTTTEAGGTAIFSIVLNTQPTANVTISIASSNTNEGTVGPASVTFTATNWNTAQNITITGVNDDVDDGDISYTITTSAAVSSDPLYSGKDPNDVSVINQDNDTAGITVSSISGPTAESGTTATFTIVLNSKPTSSVAVALSSNDLTEGTVFPGSVTFTTANWNIPQTITVTGVNDDVQDGNISYLIVTSQATSSDTNYSSINPADVNVSNTDNDIAGYTFSATSGLVTTEAGGTATFTIKLTSQPTANVTISLTSSDPGEGTVSPSSVIFTPANWNTAQTVTITGVNDYEADGNIAYTIITTISPGSDLVYNALNPSDVSVTNNDNDVAGYAISTTSGLVTTEAGGTATFTIKLTSQPSANVTINLSTSDNTEGTVSPASLVFTNSNWNVNQTVTITGVDDFVQDGNISYSIITAPAASSDANYNNLNPSDVSVTNTDNDVAGITVNPTSGLVTSEDGTTASFRVVLKSQPTTNVTIAISSSNTSEGIVSTSSLVFTTSNWNIEQTVVATGVNDHIIDGNVSYTIVTGAASSSDAVYNGTTVPDVSMTNTDNDVAGIVVEPTSGLSTSESGGTATFSFRLLSIPTSNVTIGLSSGNTNEGTISPTSIIITPANWNTPANNTVTITGVDDPVDDGNVSYTIVTSASSSSDTNYNGINPSDVSVTNINDDTAGITVDPTDGLVTSENLTSSSFTIVLDSKPTANVSINLSSSDTNEGTVSPSSVTFTSLNWNVPQVVTITGKDDKKNDGDVAYIIITAAATSFDAKYSGLNADDVSVTNQDNDTPAILVYPTSGLVTTEASGTATFNVVLVTQPQANVTITLSSSNTSEGTISTSTLTFTPSNWSNAQTVTVTGVNDLLNDGDISYSIILDPAQSLDPDYDDMSANDVSVTNTDLTPQIISFSPSSTCYGSGSSIIISGKFLTGTTSVKINGTNASYTINNATQITAILPVSATTGLISLNTPTGTATSSTSIAINPTTQITNQSTAGQTQCLNGTFTAISITATGSGTLTYQWYSNTTANNSGGNPISGATDASYTPLATSTGTLYYYCIVSADCGTATSNASGAFVVRNLVQTNPIILQ